MEAKQLLSDNFKQREDMKRLKELMQQQEEVSHSAQRTTNNFGHIRIPVMIVDAVCNLR